MSQPREVKEIDVIVTSREADSHTHGGMRGIARQVVQYHKRPAPEAVPPPVDPFPAALMWALGLGVLAGGVVGFVFGWLLRKGTIAFEGWEGLFSMAPEAFYIFWTFAGIVLGGLIVGVIAMLIIPAAPPRPVDES